MAGLDSPKVDVLIVGAGPTGLTLAAELQAQGISFRLVDKAPDAVHESRALAIQARTLEVLDRIGASSKLVARGDPATVLVMHSRTSTVEIKLFEEGIGETTYPYLLFLSQAETERTLNERLAGEGVVIERGTELRDLTLNSDSVTSTVSTETGQSTIESRFVVGCDGAHSAVRHAGGISFMGTAFPQTFVIADLEASNLQAEKLHVFVAGDGMLFFFPLGSPATWRMLVMVPPDRSAEAPTLTSVQSIVDRYSDGSVILRDAVWLTNFTVQSRRAAKFREGPVLLAGDAAHIHSPAGAQGMNTGIQDAVNLGWKLGLVCRGLASEKLLDTYGQERVPVARSVLRMTNRAFRVATSRASLLRFLRPRMAAFVIPVVLRVGVLRRFGFRTISQLSIRYRHSALSVEGKPRLRRGPRAGDRIPNAEIRIDGRHTTIHQSLSPTDFHLLLCGSAEQWDGNDEVGGSDTAPVQAARLNSSSGPGVWTDASGHARAMLRLPGSEVGHYLIRPDGHVGYRARGNDLTGVGSYLRAL